MRLQKPPGKSQFTARGHGHIVLYPALPGLWHQMGSYGANTRQVFPLGGNQSYAAGSGGAFQLPAGMPMKTPEQRRSFVPSLPRRCAATLPLEADGNAAVLKGRSGRV